MNKCIIAVALVACTSLNAGSITVGINATSVRHIGYRPVYPSFNYYNPSCRTGYYRGFTGTQLIVGAPRPVFRAPPAIAPPPPRPVIQPVKKEPAPVLPPNSRLWRNNKGQTIVAQLKAYNGRIAKLKMDGVLYSVEKTQLSAGDQLYLDSLFNADPPAPPTPPPPQQSLLKPLPAHWGVPPREQLKDACLLPNGFGVGSTTLKEWIERQLIADLCIPIYKKELKKLGH